MTNSNEPKCNLENSNCGICPYFKRNLCTYFIKDKRIIRVYCPFCGSKMEADIHNVPEYKDMDNWICRDHDEWVILTYDDIEYMIPE